MALRTPQEYRASLQDERVIYYKGERVKDVTAHAVLGVAVQHASIDYAMAENPRYRDLAVVHDPQTGEAISRYFHLPRNSDDLLKRSQLIETATGLGRTLVVLIKEIGSDAHDQGPDRKSTRLNSSHLGISYAVFCLKKKKKQIIK